MGSKFGQHHPTICGKNEETRGVFLFMGKMGEEGPLDNRSFTQTRH